MVRREGNRDPARESKRERGREGEGGRERERERPVDMQSKDIESRGKPACEGVMTHM